MHHARAPVTRQLPAVRRSTNLVVEGRNKNPGTPEPGTRNASARKRACQKTLELLAPDGLEILMMLQEHAERLIHHVGVERLAVECHERGRPVERFRHTGGLVQLDPTKFLDKGGHLR